MLRKIDVCVCVCPCVDRRDMKWERMEMSVNEWEKMIGSYESAIGCELSASNRMHFDIIKIEVEIVKMALSYDDRDGYDDINRIVFQQWHKHTVCPCTLLYAWNTWEKRQNRTWFDSFVSSVGSSERLNKRGEQNLFMFLLRGRRWLIKLIIFQFPYADMLGLNHFVCAREKKPWDLSNRSLSLSLCMRVCVRVRVCTCVCRFSHVGISFRDATIALLLFLMQTYFILCANEQRMQASISVHSRCECELDSWWKQQSAHDTTIQIVIIMLSVFLLLL